MENKKIWFIDYYAYLPEDGPHIRHYAFGKYLYPKGYNAFIFSSNELHSVGKRVETSGKLYLEKERDNVHFFYVKTHHYEKNDFNRAISIVSFEKNVRSIANEIAAKYGKPDVIYASSLNPTTLLTGFKLAKKYGIKCICEHRDIVPDGFITKGTFKENGMIAKAARLFMKRTYEKADGIVFTMEGGRDYLIDQKLDTGHGGKVDMTRVFYVNNGVDLEQSRKDAVTNVIPDDDLDDPDLFKVVYLGAIRFMNNMPLFMETAKILKEMGRTDIKILMWGTGTKIDEMRARLKADGLDNIVLKGYVEKKYIPGIAKRADVFIGTGNSSIMKYGMSFNKLFDYFAAGKPIILPFEVGNSIVAANHAGVEMRNTTAHDLVKEILRFADMNQAEYESYCKQSAKLAQQYDYAVLSEELKRAIEATLNHDH